MSKLAAIDYAVRRQLSVDDHALPTTYRERMGAAPANAPANPIWYGYDETTMQGFLMNVAALLRLDTPALDCRWTTLNVTQCVAGTVLTLEGQIETVTTVIGEKK